MKNFTIILTALCTLFHVFAIAGDGPTESLANLTQTDLKTYKNEIRDMGMAHLANMMQTGTQTRAYFDRAFDEMVSDLEIIARFQKSAADCKTACAQATAAYNDLEAAVSAAAVASDACPESVYAADANYYAGVAYETAALAVAAACDGNADALIWLDAAKRRAREAWNNAAYAWTIDGCDESELTATLASDAYLALHNALTSMHSCL